MPHYICYVAEIKKHSTPSCKEIHLRYLNVMVVLKVFSMANMYFSDKYIPIYNTSKRKESIVSL